MIHTHTPKAGIVGRLAARRAGSPRIVHTVHGFPFHEESGAATRWAYSTLERLAARWCDRIVTVSEYHRDWALRLGIGAPWTARRNTQWHPARAGAACPESREVTRQSWGLSGDQCAILATGRLGLQKGFVYLLGAASILAARGCLAPSASSSLETVRSGRTLRPAVALGVTDCVTFLGFQAQVGDLLASGRLCGSCPSLWGGSLRRVARGHGSGQTDRDDPDR